jgi:hypothetical protein
MIRPTPPRLHHLMTAALLLALAGSGGRVSGKTTQPGEWQCLAG